MIRSSEQSIWRKDLGRRLAVFLFVPAFALGLPVDAANVQQPSGAGTDKGRHGTNQPESRQRQRGESSRTFKRYVPSEKVSADKSVSFPVDI
jgi:hypothetical protein